MTEFQSHDLVIGMQDHVPPGVQRGGMTVRLYRPSNGTEGECFIGQWCAVCQHDRASRGPDGDPGEGCQILARTFAVSVDHPEYPQEWRYSDDGRPVCTAFLWADSEEIQPLDPHAVVHDLFADQQEAATA